MSSASDMANAIRFLSVDAVELANSGHPGMPLGMADIAQVLWCNFLKHNPRNPKWINRDRFVLSNGHGSMLLYSLLHLTGYDLTINDLKCFRKLGSKTPGHPEFDVTPGVEATTGPLGQGVANAVGMAISEKVLSSTFNRKNHNIIDHFTYAFVGDGCLMEGISHEACSLAGTLGLGKLIVLWDDNGISIDGKVGPWFSEDTALRFESYDFQVLRDIDGHDPEAVYKAIEQAKDNPDKPTLICCKTRIGFGSPTYENSAKVHGAPLGSAEVLKLRQNLNWPHEAFCIPEEIRDAWNQVDLGEKYEHEWSSMFESYQDSYPDLARKLLHRFDDNELASCSSQFSDWLASIQKDKKPKATRKASQECISFFQDNIGNIFGGSADLSCSNLTEVESSRPVKTSWNCANYLHFGVREFAMFAIANGMSSYGGFIPFVGTFLTFIDYGRNALRLAAMSKLRVIYVLTHDSIGLGEDGPTHQPVEHNSMLRATPNVHVWRPCDSVETAVSWYSVLQRQDGPSCLLLSRQSLSVQERDADALENIKRGGYILWAQSPDPDIIMIATGSEVELALSVAKKLVNHGIKARVVSMPCLEVFDSQDLKYKEGVLPKSMRKRFVIEAGSSQCWYKVVGTDGLVYGLDRYGDSGSGKDIMNSYGFNEIDLESAIKNFLVSYDKQNLEEEYYGN
ncbi:MAG: transketolase [Pseudomonadota bacterium]|nr:transketolase [Pseudomonadota bacterium]